MVHGADIDHAEVLRALGRSRATFNADDIAAVAQRVAGRKRPAVAERLAAAMVADPDLVPLAVGADGTQRFATTEYLAAERTMWSAAATLVSNYGQRTDPGRVAAHMAEAERRRGWSYSDQQRGATGQLVGPSNLVCVVGIAGAGKTTILEQSVAEWRASGQRVIGAAIAGIAADNLRRETGADSYTLAKLITTWDRRDQASEPAAKDDRRAKALLASTAELELDRKSVIVVDEAGMADVVTLSRVLDRARNAGAKVVLVGDPRQFGAIQAGAGFRGLVERYGAARLDQVVRQRAPEDCRASERLSQGDMRGGLGHYWQKGAIALATDRAAAKAKMTQELLAAQQVPGREGKSRALLAGTNADVVDLNARVRAGLKAAGGLADGVTIAGKDGAPTEYAVGDRIVFLKNDKELAVFNGSRGSVTAIAPIEAEEPGFGVSVRLDDGRDVQFDSRSYNDHAHAYAITGHKAQGQTIDEVWQLADRTMYGSEQAYVGGSRHRDFYRLHAGKTEFPDLDALIAAAERPGGKDLAADFGDMPFAPALMDRPAPVAPMDRPPEPANRAAPPAQPVAPSPTQHLAELVSGITTIGPAQVASGDVAASKRGTVYFEWGPQVSEGERTNRLAIMDEHPVEAKQALLDRFQQLDPRGFAAWDQAGRMPVVQTSEVQGPGTGDMGRTEALRYASETVKVRPAHAEPGKDKRGMVYFEWGPQVSQDEKAKRLAVMDEHPVEAKQALVDRFQQLDPRGFAVWDKGGRMPIPAPRTRDSRGGGIGD